MMEIKSSWYLHETTLFHDEGRYILVSLVSDLKVVGSGSIPGRTHAEGFEISEENLLTLLWHLRLVGLFFFSNKDEKQWESSFAYPYNVVLMERGREVVKWAHRLRQVC